MSMISIETAGSTGTRAQPARFAGRNLLAAIPRAVMSFLAYRAVRAAMAELSTLDDRTLKDIGLSRGDIRWVVMNAARAPRTE